MIDKSFRLFLYFIFYGMMQFVSCPIFRAAFFEPVFGESCFSYKLRGVNYSLSNIAVI